MICAPWPTLITLILRAAGLILSLVCAVGVARLAAADAAPASTGDSHSSQHSLLPIKESLDGLDLTALEALPVQHGGRYKPFHSLAMEMIDQINGGSNLGPGQTPLSSLLDLIFCNEQYQDQLIIEIKQSELDRDLTTKVPAKQRYLIQNGRIAPALLLDEGVQTSLRDIGRQMSKSKAINQLTNALQTCDTRYLVEQLRFLAIPAADHSDHWSDPVRASTSFPAALGDFVRLAAGENVVAKATSSPISDRYSLVTWNSLPLTDGSVRQLELIKGAEDPEGLKRAQNLNIEVLWPLFRAAAAGTCTTQPLPDVAALVKQGNFTPEQSQTIQSGLNVLAAAWPRMGIADADLASAGERPEFEKALARAESAWSGLGLAWAQRRLAGAPAKTVQDQVDALVHASQDLLALYNADRAARSLPAVQMDTKLELTYWRFGGFSKVWMLFILAVPLLALGGIGRSNVALGLGYVLFGTGFIFQSTAFVIRGILAQRIPLANLYESLAAASLLCSLVALIGEAAMATRSRSRAGVGALAPRTNAARGSLALGASLFGCIVVLAQYFLEKHDINAFISPQMPILSEFWLRVHTSCVVSSYGLISLGGLMSLTYLCMRIWLEWDDERCRAWDRTTFAINAMATVVLWVGLCLGAVWAAQSWGRPWGWDPKEVFALLTWVVFIMLVHLRVVVSPSNRGWATACVSLVAFIVMAFNWYIVNVVLAGLHSYA